MRSSRMPPDSLQAMQYLAWPEGMAGEGQGVGALEKEPAHVGDIEHAGMGAYGVVLLDGGAVAGGHVPAGELDHLGVEGEVGGVEGGGFHGRLRVGYWRSFVFLTFSRQEVFA